MQEIKVPFDKKDQARSLGARVINGIWCVPEDIPAENQNKLNELFGERIEATSAVASSPASKDQRDWNEVLLEDSVTLMSELKKQGFPEDKLLRSRIFNRLKDTKAGDYPVTYEGLRVFLPELNKLYPEAELKKAITTIGGGDYKKNISSIKTLSVDEKALLLFILP